MKASTIDKIIAGLTTEKAMLDGLIRDFSESTSPIEDMRAKSNMLSFFITRLEAGDSRIADVRTPRKPRTKKADKPNDLKF